MILHVHGNINRYYVQSLCMIFFPGSTFGENEVAGEDVPEVLVHVYPDEENSITAYASIKLNDRLCEATATVSRELEIAVATHETIAVGRAVFAAGKDMLGHIPPWGILTGIRPAKVAGNLLRAGKGIIKSKKILRDEYFVHPQKAALAVSVASNEMKLLKKAPKDAASLYISIPFCPTRCAYCSFVSYTTKKLLSLIDEYVDALIEELDETLNTVKELNREIATIYIGGGTPTTLTTEQLTRIFRKISEYIDVNTLREFTLEAGRPDTITKEKLAIAKEFGVTRVSVNPQTLSDNVLREIGRRHTVEDFYRAFEIAKESGIRDINVDLIAGLPNDDFESFSETVDKIIELRPTNITVHTFTVKKAADVLKKGSSVYSINATDATKSVAYSQVKTKFAGYKPYYMYKQKNTISNLENVGYAIEGHEGLYNVFMMEETQSIFGVGAGAVTKLLRPDDKNGGMLIKRIFNPKYPYEYLRYIQDKKTGADKKLVKEQIFEYFNKI